METRTAGENTRGRAMIWVCTILAVVFLVGWAAPASAADKATFRLEWKLTGYHLPFYWAKEKGYFAKEGIDLEIREGTGSGNTVNFVGAGRDTFGFADYLVMAKGVGRGMPVKAVFGIVQKTAWAIVSFEDKAIRKPQDLIGRSVAAAPYSKSILELWLKANNIPLDKVSMRIVSGRVQNSIFLERKADSLLSITTGSPMDFVVKAKQGNGDPIHFLPFADTGVSPMGQGIIVNNDLIKKNPDLIRRFVRALKKGWMIAPTNVNEAVRIALKHAPGNEKRAESVKLQWLNMLELMRTPNTEGKPLGWMSEKDWKITQDVMVKTGTTDKPVPLSDYYTNEFVPGD